MSIKTFRPITPVLRYKTVNGFDQITTDVPYKPLCEIKKKNSGRNNHGHITVRHRGGGYRKYYRVIDFKRNKINIPGKVESIEYDPNRTSFIARIIYLDGERRYIIATSNMKVGQVVLSSEQCEIAEGNCMQLKHIPLGSFIHNIQMRIGKSGQIARGAGAYGEVLAKENNFVQIKLPSTEIRNISENCVATIGQVSNIEHMNVVIGSAGRKRHMGIRPTVRGVVMNPVDHPNGGGEGKSKGGGGFQHLVSPWGQKAKGLKTRTKRKPSSKYIVSRRTK